jgi:hypothetical protein
MAEVQFLAEHVPGGARGDPFVFVRFDFGAKTVLKPCVAQPTLSYGLLLVSIQFKKK